MSLVVHKYGGSSLATPSHIHRAAERIRETRLQGKSMVIVVSAMGRMTDHLIRLSRKIVEKPSPRELDMLLTTGERVSMSLLAMALEALGVPAISFTGSQSGILTDHHHNNAKILAIRPSRIRTELDQHKVVIIAGFQGVSPEKEITTLGRGGSDTTAVALALTLQAEECVIFTDVNGLFTADPKTIGGAKVIARLHYDEALELSSLGAKMHPRSVDLARRHGVKLVVRSSFNDETMGTTIDGEGTMENVAIRGVTTQTGFDYWDTEKPLQEIALLMERLGITLRFFVTDGRRVQFLANNTRAGEIRALLHDSRTVSGVGIVSIVGSGIGSHPSILREFLSTLAPYEVLSVNSNSLSISAAVNGRDLVPIAQRLHDSMVSPSNDLAPRLGAIRFD